MPWTHGARPVGLALRLFFDLFDPFDFFELSYTFL